MEIPITLLSLTENYLMGVLLGASTLAVISYGISLRFGYPREGIGNALIQSIYTLLRLFHIFLTILVALYIIVFGIMDGIPEVWYEYGVKAFVLVANACIAFGMAHWRETFPVDYFAPAIGAGWYFLASYHSYYSAVGVKADGVVGAIILYLVLLGVFQLLFLVLRHVIHPISDKGGEKGDNENSDTTQP